MLWKLIYLTLFPLHKIKSIRLFKYLRISVFIFFFSGSNSRKYHCSFYEIILCENSHENNVYLYIFTLCFYVSLCLSRWYSHCRFLKAEAEAKPGTSEKSPEDDDAGVKNLHI